MKNKFIKYFLFLVLPIIIFVYAILLRKAFGEGFFMDSWDAQYTYLMNSASIAQGRGITHFWHPGTPVNLVGGILVRSIYFLSPENIKMTDIDTSILMHSDWYLNIMFYFYGVLKTLILIFIGIFIYNITSSIYKGLIFQLTPLGSIFIMKYGYTQIIPESYVFMTALIFMVVIYYFYNSSQKASQNQLIGVGVLSGFGFASKLIFGPLALLPLFVADTKKKKATYMFSFFVSFLVLILPVLNIQNFKTSFQYFFVNILVNKGRYGFGEKGFDVLFFLQNLKEMYLHNFFIIFLSVLIVIFLVFYIIKRKDFLHNGDKPKEQIAILFLLYTLAFFISIVYVANSYRDRYLIALLVTLIPFLLIFSEVIFANFNKNAKSNSVYKYLFFSIFSILIINHVWSIKGLDYIPFKKISESYEINGLLKNEYNDFAKIHYIESSTLPLAWCYSQYYAETYYGEKLNALYPNDFIYHLHDGVIFNYTRDTIHFDDLKKQYNNKVVMVGTPLDNYFNLMKEFAEPHMINLIKLPPYEKEDVFKGESITIYKVH